MQAASVGEGIEFYNRFRPDLVFMDIQLPDGDGQTLYDAVSGKAIAAASTKGIDFNGALHYARTVGNPALRKMSFQERGRMLRALALYLLERKEKFYTISYKTGATRIDSWIDIEGGIGNLFSNAKTTASAISSTNKNSLLGVPVPHTTISVAPLSFASCILRMRAGNTCELVRL